MALVSLFLDIALLRKCPQDSPASAWLLRFLVGVNLAVGTVLALALFDISLAAAVFQAVTGALLLGGYLWAVLLVSGKSYRFVQSAIANFGCDTLMSVVALVLVTTRVFLPDFGGEIGGLLLLLTLWQIIVIGHILRHALSRAFSFGFGLAMLYGALSNWVATALFPLVE